MNARAKALIGYIFPALGGLFVTYLYNVVDGRHGSVRHGLLWNSVPPSAAEKRGRKRIKSNLLGLVSHNSEQSPTKWVCEEKEE